MQRWTELEERRIALGERVRAMPEGQRTTPPFRGALAPDSTILHMAIVDEFYPPLLEAGQKSGIVGQAAKPNFMHRFAVRRMNAVKSIPTPGSLAPSSGLDLEAAINRWAEVRSRIEPFVHQAPYERAALKHPFFGLLSLSDLLDVMEAHQTYHEHRLSKPKR
ncbi:MAG: DinB family protein [Armatimonadetes bacterium]|nr:DinB family protein [Armatimonadota bacterium]